MRHANFKCGWFLTMEAKPAAHPRIRQTLPLLGQWLAVILAALGTEVLSNALLGLWIDLGWRRPIQDWMSAHGLGAFAGKFALIYIDIPKIFISFSAGAIIGMIAFRRWFWWSCVYGVLCWVTIALSFI